MNYIHLTTFERGQIECLYGLGWSIRAIAKELGRSHSTVSREIQLIHGDNYCSEAAHEQYLDRRKVCKPKGKWSPSLGQLLEDKLLETWSPEQIVGRLLYGKISFKTIYRWIYQGLLAKGNLLILRQKGKRKKTIEKHLVIGKQIRWYLEEGKARDVLPPLLNEKLVCM